MPLVLVLLLGQGAVVSAFLGRGSGAAPYLNLAHIAVLVVLELFAKLRVDIDDQGLCIRYGYLGWLRQRVPLERVVAARAFQLEPMQHGGWGYRGNVRWSGRAAIVVRGGPALGLTLQGDRQLAITVDDADAAARFINRRLARRTPPAPDTTERALAPG